MARKTKAEAALTKDRIVTCARQVFARDGVTNTSLEEVARVAGVTRGAVYWHFRNKADLFMAVRSQTGLLIQLGQAQGGDPLQRLENGLKQALQRLSDETAAQETYEVMLWKCEYVGEFAQVRDDLLGSGSLFLDDAEALYREALAAGIVAADLDPKTAAVATFCFYAGILKIWLADTRGTILRKRAQQAIAHHIAQQRRAPLATTRQVDRRGRPAKDSSP
ncbi:MAG: TetR family transcriptional regulator [Opitutales bacterium]|jgi:TetR/AcrR family acrAB operon transcriptional repressor|nr:MAG: TetR family transcriptional regulator [Opitutales bacterium]